MTTLAARCQSLPRSARRTIALASIPLLLLLFWGVVVVPAQALYRAQDEWREDAVATLERARGSKDHAAIVSKQLAELPSAPIWNKFFVVDRPGAAASQLQMEIGAILNSLHIPVQSLTPVQSTEMNGLTAIGLRVAASLTVDQLKALVARTYDNPHYLRIERLRINAPPSQSRDQNATLTVTLEFFGIERVRSDQSSKGKDASS